jgi:hypothetical protein
MALVWYQRYGPDRNATSAPIYLLASFAIMVSSCIYQHTVLTTFQRKWARIRQSSPNDTKVFLKVDEELKTQSEEHGPNRTDLRSGWTE